MFLKISASEYEQIIGMFVLFHVSLFLTLFALN